ncbi:hypothetical protein P5648_22965 (plasmid) [Bacillus subtilis]
MQAWEQHLRVPTPFLTRTTITKDQNQTHLSVSSHNGCFLICPFAFRSVNGPRLLTADPAEPRWLRLSADSALRSRADPSRGEKLFIKALLQAAAVIKTFPAETWPPEVGHLPTADLTNHLWVIFVLHVKRAKLIPFGDTKPFGRQKSFQDKNKGGKIKCKKI